MADAGTMGQSVVLLGGGHAHVEVVRRLGQLGLGAQISLVSPSRHAPYSGMLPGHVAGEYEFDDFHIDLAQLCARNGVTFIETAAIGIDTHLKKVSLACGDDLAYNLLSIDIGSTPALPEGISGGLSVKPISSFTDRLSRLDALVAEGRPLCLAVIGQGVAGVEIAFALRRRFEGRDIRIALAGRAAGPVPERSRRARLLVERALHAADIAHYPAFDVIAFEDNELTARDGRQLAVDAVVWTTSSGAPAWLRQTGLSLDAGGFIKVDHMLQSVSQPHVFAAGDVASLPDPRPKAGVFAVRQGPVLAENIHRYLLGRPLTVYRPQRFWLVLISLGYGRAIADKWGMAISGDWVARWKHRTDSRFMQRYR
ncbi:MAG: FAD-dependent oxidoreductase [Alphaproteobacteria bacterium]|nr:FAD-dependent oxidoreductase [Alphaproteobacteria bacterium]